MMCFTTTVSFFQGQTSHALRIASHLTAAWADEEIYATTNFVFLENMADLDEPEMTTAAPPPSVVSKAFDFVLYLW